MKRKNEGVGSIAGFLTDAVVGEKDGSDIGIVVGRPIGAIVGEFPCAIVGGPIGLLGGNKVGTEMDRA